MLREWCCADVVKSAARISVIACHVYEFSVGFIVELAQGDTLKAQQHAHVLWKGLTPFVSWPVVAGIFPTQSTSIQNCYYRIEDGIAVVAMRQHVKTHPISHGIS